MMEKTPTIIAPAEHGSLSPGDARAQLRLAYR